MIVLEVIAPVPIMSLIDPKGAKDGAFSHWVKSLTSTFLDIFLKLGLVYVVIVLIHLLVNANDKGGIFSEFPERQGFRGTYLTIFLILGLIFFAKEAPKFIKDALGLKDTGGGNLFDDVKTIGKAAGLVGGAAAGLAIAGAGNISNTAESAKEGKWGQAAKNFFGSPGAAVAGAIRGGQAGLKGAGKNGNPIQGISGAISSQAAVNAGKYENQVNGSTFLGRSAARLGGLVGRTPADLDEAQIAGYKAVEEAAKDVDDALTKGIVGNGFTSRHADFNNGHGGRNFTYREYRSAVDRNDTQWARDHDYSSIAEAAADEKRLTDKAKQNFYNEYTAALRGGSSMDEYQDLMSAEQIMKNAARSAKTGSDFSNYDGFKKSKDAAKSGRRRTLESPKYASRKRNAAAVKKSKK
jgi:hypothetical protein